MYGRVLMALGSYRFSISTAAHEQIERNTEWRWPAQERIGMAPALQYVGPGEDTITMSGTIYPQLGPGLGQVDAMRAQAGLGQPLALVTGFGKYLGLWSITSIRENQSSIFYDGVPKKIEFSLELKAYN
jgi:uncharacterized protein